MATTGFWPIKSNLKSVIDYADNPDKITERKYLDEDLLNAISYIENDDKTDEKLYVTGINCSKFTAYEQMTATKQKYHKTGGNVAYHGFQSFAEGEVTPEECHQIGIETAKQMWGDKYEVLVTTHLNCQNHLHNHFVVNSVSFKTGEKFKNKIGDHLELRKISDKICRERNLSVLENSSFYGGEKEAYWLHREGKITRRDLLAQDAEYALKHSLTPADFLRNLERLGYEIDRTRLTVKAPDWERGIRLNNIGFTREYIESICQQNYSDKEIVFYIRYNPIPKPKKSPLDEFMEEITHKYRVSRSGIESILSLLFLLLITILHAAIENYKSSPLSPSMRLEIQNFKNHVNDYHFLQDNNLNKTDEVLQELQHTDSAINELEAERQSIRNKIRRASPEEKSALKQQAKAITEKLTPLRERAKTLERIYIESDKVLNLIKTEMQLGEKARNNRDRGAR